MLKRRELQAAFDTHLHYAHSISSARIARTQKMSPLLSHVTALFCKALIWNIFVCKKPLLNKMINPDDKYSTFSSSARGWQMLG